MTEPRTMRARTGFAPLLLAALLLGGCGGGGEAPSGGSGPDVLAVSRANGLDAFVAAVDTAGMTETLSGPGPYTVFAPTDRAMPSNAAIWYITSALSSSGDSST